MPVLPIRTRPRDRNSKIRCGCRKDAFSAEKPIFLPEKTVFSVEKVSFQCLYVPLGFGPTYNKD